MASAIGATAISSVMRSDSMRRSTSSRSNRAVQAHRGAGRGRGEQVEQAEDVRRRRGHLEPVVGAEPERLAPVRGGVADRAVRVAHRLRQPGRARAEHEHRLVGRRARRRPAARSRSSARAASSAGAVVEVGDAVGAQPLGEQRGAGTVGDGVRPGAVSSTAWSTSTRLPRRAEQHGGRAELADGVDRDDELDPVRHHHRHPVAGPDAARRRGGGRRRCRAGRGRGTSTARRRPARRRDRRTGRRPARARGASAAAVIGNILLAFEIDVNMDRNVRFSG